MESAGWTCSARLLWRDWGLFGSRIGPRCSGAWRPTLRRAPYWHRFGIRFRVCAFRNGSDLFHRNVRRILDSCWPDLDFDQQMKKVWITESVLCSASRECGTVSSSIGVTCALRYLIPQIKLFDSALVVALGRKSQARLRSVGFHDFYPAFAVAPPGCNQKAAKESWARIPNELEKKMSLTKRCRQLR